MNGPPPAEGQEAAEAARSAGPAGVEQGRSEVPEALAGGGAAAEGGGPQPEGWEGAVA